ncbi:hypothetical protein CDAR_225241 [Caerostris darwini]|uniref:Uncharacterized protein n=1 Tax=Caerostris darwini TaxID=1538125 RepID=A0AAV4W8L3_9ARAC|nr:hypothetical protein CDAR_225241 [Caerostris darwini]
MIRNHTNFDVCMQTSSDAVDACIPGCLLDKFVQCLYHSTILLPPLTAIPYIMCMSADSPFVYCCLTAYTVYHTNEVHFNSQFCPAISRAEHLAAYYDVTGLGLLCNYQSLLCALPPLIVCCYTLYTYN